MTQELWTERLVLRGWRASDIAPFAAMNADPRVMELFPALKSREESSAAIERFEAHHRKNGYTLWAAELVGIAPFIGFIGICNSRFIEESPAFVEIGWRLAFEFWGQGLATEGAREALRFGFEEAGLAVIVSYAAVGNMRSRRVMEKIGMVRDVGADFDHPAVPEGSPVRRHVLYRADRR